MNKNNKLTPEDREEIRRRMEAGEKQTVLAAEFGVTRQAISLLKKRPSSGGNVERFGRHMTKAEQEKFKATLETSTPEDHGLGDDLMYDPEMWTIARAHALAEQLAGARLRKFPVTKLIKSWYPEGELWGIVRDNGDKPAPIFRRPRQRSIDPDFDAFLQSPIGKKIQSGAVTNAVDIFTRRIQSENPDAVIEHLSPGPAHPAPPLGLRPVPRPNVRTGKHKGTTIGKAKKRKKKK